MPACLQSAEEEEEEDPARPGPSSSKGRKSGSAKKVSWLRMPFGGV